MWVWSVRIICPTKIPNVLVLPMQPAAKNGAAAKPASKASAKDDDDSDEEEDSDEEDSEEEAKVSGFITLPSALKLHSTG